MENVPAAGKPDLAQASVEEILELLKQDQAEIVKINADLAESEAYLKESEEHVAEAKRQIEAAKAGLDRVTDHSKLIYQTLGCALGFSGYRLKPGFKPWDPYSGTLTTDNSLLGEGLRWVQKGLLFTIAFDMAKITEGEVKGEDHPLLTIGFTGGQTVAFHYSEGFVYGDLKAGQMGVVMSKHAPAVLQNGLLYLGVYANEEQRLSVGVGGSIAMVWFRADLEKAGMAWAEGEFEAMVPQARALDGSIVGSLWE